jgi:hypothetical protein
LKDNGVVRERRTRGTSTGEKSNKSNKMLSLPFPGSPGAAALQFVIRNKKGRRGNSSNHNMRIIQDNKNFMTKLISSEISEDIKID